ncbi:PREDICTED: polyadenylate-binding protein-interacting protein 9-like [Nicrophorus vespilloides]|uniref:Polyadenylate-binding protein-interacting protein 9-like n=1 Tax=Nicrophorus vespilloides TaxID=110193 RepID=A0ABM1MFZ9_NICVS|nr:PREDICTED: polyadenylate-binding protein-interacting protein 9-like [Nicrophorus vespilloides]
MDLNIENITNIIMEMEDEQVDKDIEPLSISDKLLIAKAKAFNSSIYVGNLDHSVTKQELNELFCRCGCIKKIKIPKVNGLPKGHAFIEFLVEYSIYEATTLNGTYLGDKPIEVSPRNMDRHGSKVHETAMEVQIIDENCKPSTSMSIDDKEETRNNCIYVGNLDPKVTKTDLGEHFFKCGFIENISIPVCETTGLPEGHAYIDFYEENSVFAATCMDGTYLGDKPIQVHSNTPANTSRPYTNGFGPSPEVEDSNEEDEQEEESEDSSSIDAEMTAEELAEWQRSEAVMRVRRWRLTSKPY